MTSGSFNACPPPTGHCNTNTTHFGDLRVWLPHGLAGANAHVEVPPTTDVGPYLISHDFSATCDPFFGDPNDPECIPQASGAIQCSQTAVQFAGTGGNTPPPPVRLKGLSYYVASFDTNIVSTYAVQVSSKTWVGEAVCGATLSACTFGQHAICAPPFIPNTVTEVVEITTDIPLNASEVENIAKNGCYDHDAVAAGKAWRRISTYDPKVGASSCVLFPFPETVKAPSNCF